MIQALRNAWRLPDVRNKLLFTGFILIVYQFAAHVPVVGVDRVALRQVFESGSSAGNLIQVMNLLSGGAVANFSVIANGVYPYITASIIFQLLVPIVPALERIQREPGGQEKIQRYTYYVAIPMAVLQALGQISIFNLATGTGTEIIPGFGFGVGNDMLLTVSVLTTMTAGTMFAIWLGELITEQGIGNGISIIIFAGIVAQAPQNLIRLITQQPDRSVYNLALFVVITVLSVLAVVVIQEGVRRIPVQYGRRVRGNRQFAQQDSFIPLRVNPVGMIPLIFAQSIITFPAIIASLFPPGPVGNTIQTTFGNQQGLLYWGTFFPDDGGIHLLLCRSDGRQSKPCRNLATQWRIHPGHSARQAHRGLHQIHNAAYYLCWRFLPGCDRNYPWYGGFGKSRHFPTGSVYFGRRH